MLYCLFFFFRSLKIIGHKFTRCEGIKWTHKKKTVLNLAESRQRIQFYEQYFLVFSKRNPKYIFLLTGVLFSRLFLWNMRYLYTLCAGGTRLFEQTGGILTAIFYEKKKLKESHTLDLYTHILEIRIVNVVFYNIRQMPRTYTKDTDIVVIYTLTHTPKIQLIIYLRSHVKNICD